MGPDDKVVVMMLLTLGSTFYFVSYFFTKYHFINTYSHRLELYAVKDGGAGYKKFRAKAFKTHKMAGNWLNSLEWCHTPQACWSYLVLTPSSQSKEIEL